MNKIPPSRRLMLPLLSLQMLAAAAVQAQDGARPAPDPAAAAAVAQQQTQLRQREVLVAQAHAAVAAADAQVQAHVRLLSADSAFEFARSELGAERLVKGAPYCAEAVHETIQPLADGNRIVRSQSSRLCRDGEGRTRQEVERNGRHSVYLRDPVAKESWVLDVERKKARQAGAGSPERLVIQQDSSVWREYSEKMREWSQKMKEHVRQSLGKEGAVPPVPPAPPVPPTPPEPVVVTRTVKIYKDAEGRDKQVEELDVKGAARSSFSPLVLPTPPAPPVPSIEVPPAVALRAINFAPRGAGVSSALGSKEIEGIKVNGERTSWTIEAGKVGNEKPIVITRDVWTSPELMITVATRDFDPRSGEVNYRLQNLKRAEPDAALMKVPADYEQIKQRKQAAPAAPATPAVKG